MKAKVAELVKNADVIESRGSSDTIRLWENYREQATMWRALSLLQVPVSALAIIFALLMWANQRIILNVPAKPLPGQHAAEEIPDAEFIDSATNFVNLLATYQYANVRKQFLRAREMVINPLLDRFEKDILVAELRTVETTNRTQVFFVDPSLTKVKREGKTVTVELTGERVKMIAGREIEPMKTSYVVTLTTIPRNDLNPYGIVVRDFTWGLAGRKGKIIDE